MSDSPQQPPGRNPLARTRRGEGEKLLAAQRLFRDQLQNAGESSDSILQAMRQIATAANEAVEKAAAGLGGCRELEATVKKTGLRGEGLTHRVVDCHQTMHQTLLAVQAQVEQVQGMMSENSRILDQAKTLGALTTEIDQKVGGVVASAEQITLLALNAVIAANRAGRFGQAFSVVANEVQTLAERSAASAEEIRTLASSIQGEVRGVLDSIEEIRRFSTDEIASSQKLVEDLRAAESEGSAVQGECRKVQGCILEIEPVAEAMRRNAERVSSSSDEFARRIRKALAASETQRELFGTMEFSLEAYREAVKSMVSSREPDAFDSAAAQIGMAVEGLAEMVGGVEHATRDAVAGIHEIAEVASREVEQVKLSQQERERGLRPIETLHGISRGLRERMQGLERRVEKEINGGIESFLARAEQSSQRIRGALDRIQGLRSQTRRIQKIAWEISLVIQETNVMAFNGSVEAVRAGQFGRSFSQVAEDVRELARESIQSADRIQDVVQEIQEQLSSMLSLLAEAGEKSRTVAGAARATLEGLRLVRHHFQAFFEEMEELSGLGQDLESHLRSAALGIDSMVLGLDAIGKTAVLSRAEARDRAKAIESLEERVGQLRAAGASLGGGL